MAYGGYYSPNFYPNYFGNQQMPPQAPQMPSNPVQSYEWNYMGFGRERR